MHKLLEGYLNYSKVTRWRFHTIDKYILKYIDDDDDASYLIKDKYHFKYPIIRFYKKYYE